MSTGGKGRAGSLESCDALVTVELGGTGIRCRLDSPVTDAYGDEMRRQIMGVAERLKITAAEVAVTDRGAVNFVLRARVEAALRRAMAKEEG